MLGQAALALAPVQRAEAVDASRVREVGDDAVLLVARRLDCLVAEEDMHRELGRVHAARPAAKARPAVYHIRRVVGDGEEDGRVDVVREASGDARGACLSSIASPVCRSENGVAASTSCSMVHSSLM